MKRARSTRPERRRDRTDRDRTGRDRTGRDRTDPDRAMVRSQALRVGAWVALGCALAVLIIVGALAALVLSTVSPAELLDSDHEAHIVLGAGDLLEIGALLGVLAVVAAGVIGMLAARSAISPLAEALARQRRFVADASHELRTPATVLDLRVQRLQQSMAAEDPHRELVAALREDSRRLGDVITDMLASVEQELDPSPPDEADAADAALTVRSACAALEPLAQSQDVHLVVRTPPGPVLVPVGEVPLTRVVTALVDNAVKHSSPGGSVEILVREEAATVLLRIRDHGPGIQGIHAERIFDRFARSSPAVGGGGDARRGFGIGLSLVRETVTRAGGSVRVAATGAEGTTLEVAFPRTPAPAAPLLRPPGTSRRNPR